MLVLIHHYLNLMKIYRDSIHTQCKHQKYKERIDRLIHGIFTDKKEDLAAIFEELKMEANVETVVTPLL